MQRLTCLTTTGNAVASNMEPAEMDAFKVAFLDPDFDKDEFIVDQLQTQRLGALQSKLLHFVSAQKHEVSKPQ